MKTLLSRFLPVGLLIVLLGTLSTGCITEKKVKKYLDKNTIVASDYCATTYPIIETTDTTIVIDSTTYKDAYEYLVRFSDSLLYELSQGKPDTITIERVRESIRTEIKYRLKPCLDSTILIQKTKESTAKITQLSELNKLKDKRIEDKDQTISKRDRRIGDLEDKNASLKKWKFWLILLVIALGLYITRGLWLPLIHKLQFLTKL